MKTLKVGLIGLGAISERHFAAFSACSQVRITALCTRSETNLAKRCAAWNIDAGYTDYRKMIEEADIDAVVVSLPPVLHKEVCMLAMKAKNETAEKFQALVADEIIPSIRKTGNYSIVQADPNLPPELAMVEGLLNSMKQMYSTQQRHDKAIEQLTESMDTMKEVMTTDVNGDWRTACGHAIQAVARKLGGGKAYEEAWNEVYTEMERNGFFVRRRLENRKKSAAAQGMSPTYVRKLNALDIIADSKDKKLMSAFINATKKLAAAHSVRMDRLNELPAVEEQPEQTAFERGA